MTDIKTATERYRLAHEARQQWLVQLRRLEAERERLQAEIPILDQRAAEADAAKTSALADYVSGTIGQADVSQARKAAEEAHDRVAEAREILEAVSRGISSHSNQHLHIVHEQEAARTVFCLAMSAPIEEKLRADQKLRRQLVDAFAAICSVRGDNLNPGAKPNWDGLLVDIFTSPIQKDAGGVLQYSPELTEAIERFEREHITPIIGATKTTEQMT